jgi:hypothetical protein
VCEPTQGSSEISAMRSVPPAWPSCRTQTDAYRLLVPTAITLARPGPPRKRISTGSDPNDGIRVRDDGRGRTISMRTSRGPERTTPRGVPVQGRRKKMRNPLRTSLVVGPAYGSDGCGVLRKITSPWSRRRDVCKDRRSRHCQYARATPTSATMIPYCDLVNMRRLNCNNDAGQCCRKLAHIRHIDHANARSAAGP